MRHFGLLSIRNESLNQSLELLNAELKETTELNIKVMEQVLTNPGSQTLSLQSK